MTRKPDIYLPTVEGSIVGIIPGLRGQEAVNAVIEELLGIRKKLYHSKAWLKLQRSKGKSITQIANECGVSAQVIDVYLKKFGLK